MFSTMNDMNMRLNLTAGIENIISSRKGEQVTKKAYQTIKREQATKKRTYWSDGDKETLKEIIKTTAGGRHHRVITGILKAPPHVIHSSWCTITDRFSAALGRDVEVLQVRNCWKKIWEKEKQTSDYFDKEKQFQKKCGNTGGG